MTFRCIWTPPGSPFPAHIDHETVNEAHKHALWLSRALSVEVEVHNLAKGAQIGSYRMHQYDERQTWAATKTEPVNSAANETADAPPKPRSLSDGPADETDKPRLLFGRLLQREWGELQ